MKDSMTSCYDKYCLRHLPVQGQKKLKTSVKAQAAKKVLDGTRFASTSAQADQTSVCKADTSELLTCFLRCLFWMKAEQTFHSTCFSCNEQSMRLLTVTGIACDTFRNRAARS